MQFIRTEGTTKLEEALANKLNGLLAEGKKVLWLLPGGSNINVAVRVMARLTGDLSKLELSLTDERYGEIGHPDSNRAQLDRAGLELGGAKFIDYLDGSQLSETILNIETKLKSAFAEADEIVGFFGMGPDGHTAGILPHSVASTEQSKWIVGYDAGQFKRITLTPVAIEKIDVAFVGVFGSEKLVALTNLQSKSLPVTEQPAQALKQIKNSFVYNDQIGG